jgi:hypothetical protein
MLLFPSFQSQYLQGITVNVGYSFILKPPTYSVANTVLNSQVNFGLLAVQLIIVTAIGGILFLALKSNKPE